MQLFWLITAILVAGSFFYLFIRGPWKFSPLWLMYSAWSLALLLPRIHLSHIELPLSGKFFGLVMVSLISFTLGFFATNWVWDKIVVLYHPELVSGSRTSNKPISGFRLKAGMTLRKVLNLLQRNKVSIKTLHIAVYVFFILSLIGLYLFYKKAGNFPLLARDPDEFRFRADEQVPGLINYVAQLARLYIPFAFFVMLWQGFNFRKHFDLIVVSVIGTIFLILFASRTQVYFIDLWVMALYLFMRKPNLKQAFKFYPIFLFVSVVVLAAVPIIRNARSYGGDYLGNITEINEKALPHGAKYALPIYVGISFNMQALQHAQSYYETHALQHGKVALDPFTNIVGLHNLKSNYDLAAIFKSWWNTGTYLFPFVQDFGNWAFVFVPFVIASVLTLLWHYWQTKPNFLSINLYAYACFFIVMTIYLSFTVRAEMYIDLFLLFVIYLVVTSRGITKSVS